MEGELGKEIEVEVEVEVEAEAEAEDVQAPTVLYPAHRLSLMCCSIIIGRPATPCHIRLARSKDQARSELPTSRRPPHSARGRY